ncbi:MAG: DUF975 family protein [Clostridia bacterium]|nr:DUF975 family protein [Clostridia bacterium]
MYAKDFRHKAWSLLSGNWGTYIVICLIASLIDGACTGLSSAWGIGAIALLIISGPLSLGLAICFLKLVRGQRTEIQNMFEGFNNFMNAFLLNLLNSLFISLWSLLFIIPGIIKSYAYSMSFYILADEPTLDANTARLRSIELMRGNKWRLFCLDLSFIGWYILCFLTLGILTFWVAPYHSAARAVFYQRILDEKNGNVNANANAQSFTQNTNINNNGGSVFGTGYGSENGAENSTEDNSDPYPEFKGDNNDENTFTKGNGEPPLNADDL